MGDRVVAAQAATVLSISWMLCVTALTTWWWLDDPADRLPFEVRSVLFALWLVVPPLAGWAAWRRAEVTDG